MLRLIVIERRRKMHAGGQAEWISVKHRVERVEQLSMVLSETVALAAMCVHRGWAACEANLV